MFCTNCGANVPDDSKFCGECGFSFDGDDAPQTQSPPPEYQQAPPINQPQTSGGNQATTILATVCVCVIVAAAVGGAYFLGARSSDDSSSHDEAGVVTQAPSDSTSETTASSDTTTAESTTPTESATTPDPSTTTGETTTEIPEAPTYEAPAEPVNHDYIIPDSNTRYLTHQELHTSGLTQEELALARNEIYARHGRQFSNPSYQAWFDSKPWYQNIYPKYSGTTFDSLNPTPLSAIEIDNIETIKQVESVYGNVPG